MPVIGLARDLSGTSYYVDGVEVLKLTPIAPLPQAGRVRKMGNVLSAPFPNAAAKVRRAATHIDAAYASIRDYLSTAQWEIGWSTDPKTRELVFQITMKQALPAELETIISDALSNMRSALNLLVSDMVRANQRQVSKQNAFPSAESKQKYAREVDKRLENVSLKARRFIDRLRPHGDGNLLFWRLAEIRNTDEHHYVLPVVLGRLSMAIQAGIPGIFFGPDGSLSIGGGAPGSRPAGFEDGPMSPGDAPDIILAPGVPTEVYRAKPGMEHLLFEVSVSANFLIGPEIGHVDLLMDLYALVSRTVAIAQRTVS